MIADREEAAVDTEVKDVVPPGPAGVSSFAIADQLIQPRTRVQDVVAGTDDVPDQECGV
jgi:hypothetical protein